MKLSLVPTRATFRPCDNVSVEIEGCDDAELNGTVRVVNLGDPVLERPVALGGVVHLGKLAEGNYGVEVSTGLGTARTAVEVTSRPRSRLRYGFLADYRPGKDTRGVARLARRLHLNGIQFYDWAYRHADLMGGGPTYQDALGQTIDVGVVRSLVEDLHEVGADALGYAAVYAVGPREWHRWREHALLRPTGEPYSLGDFLFLVDPGNEEWLDHFCGDLAQAVEQVGFDGFHLDQYGYPKYAATPDGEFVDVGRSFGTCINTARTRLPATRLVFNNVNDFPTWVTTAAPQDAVYIEPWAPNTTLESLAAIVVRAKAASRGMPVVLAAYQHVYDVASREESDRAAALTMATLYSHGATQLLTGEDGHLLVDPYYVRNRVADPETLEFLTRWYDFLVENDALLMDPRISDVTGSYVGEYNGDLDVTYEDVEVSEQARPGAVWRRVTSTPQGLVVHLINLVGQSDTEWDAPRAELGSTGRGVLRVRTVAGREPRVRFADPDGQPTLRDVPVSQEGDCAIAEIPPVGAWQMVQVCL